MSDSTITVDLAVALDIAGRMGRTEGRVDSIERSMIDMRAGLHEVQADVRKTNDELDAQRQVNAERHAEIIAEIRESRREGTEREEAGKAAMADLHEDLKVIRPAIDWAESSRQREEGRGKLARQWAVPLQTVVGSSALTAILALSAYMVKTYGPSGLVVVGIAGLVGVLILAYLYQRAR